MKYYSAITSLVLLSILAIIGLLYIGNITRNIEKQNYSLLENINYYKDQININEIEYSLHSSYENLQNLKKIYIGDVENINTNSRISFETFKNVQINHIHTVGIQ